MKDLEIRYFLEVVNQGVNFTKAAQTLYVSQPAITMHINNLGKELGVKLFDTSNKSSPKLTPAGILYYQMFRQWKESLQKTKNETALLAKQEEGTINMAGFSEWRLDYFKDTMEKFELKYPQIKTGYSACGLKVLKNGLLDNRFDIIMSFADQFRDKKQFLIHEFYQNPCFLLFSLQHKPSFYSKHAKTSGEVSIYDFENEPFYVLAENESPCLKLRFATWCKSKGFVPRFQEVSNAASILIFVHAGSGYTIVDSLVWARENPQFKCLPLDLSLPAAFIWKKDNKNMALQRFLESYVYSDGLLNSLEHR
jgi:DNA-binding transcriptional LysR family regulator